MVESEGHIRLNPDIAKVVCSVTGSETDAKEYSQPLALCACCPPSGKPLVVVYELDAIRERLGDSGWGTGPGIWRYGALLPVLGLPWRYAPDVGLTQAVRNESLGPILPGASRTAGWRSASRSASPAVRSVSAFPRRATPGWRRPCSRPASVSPNAWCTCPRTTGAASNTGRRSSSAPRCVLPVTTSRPQERS